MNLEATPRSYTPRRGVRPSATPSPALIDRPSWWLRAGFVRYEHSRGWAWIYRRADLPVDPGDLPLPTGEVDRLFNDRQTQALLVRLAEIFAPFLPITAAEWEADLRQAPWPETLLKIWESALGVYSHYTEDKKLPAGAAIDYFWLIVEFCNTGAADFLGYWRLRALKPARATRVIGEVSRWFRRELSL